MCRSCGRQHRLSTALCRQPCACARLPSLKHPAPGNTAAGAQAGTPRRPRWAAPDVCDGDAGGGKGARSGCTDQAHRTCSQDGDLLACAHLRTRQPLLSASAAQQGQQEHAGPAVQRVCTAAPGCPACSWCDARQAAVNTLVQLGSQPVSGGRALAHSWSQRQRPSPHANCTRPGRSQANHG